MQIKGETEFNVERGGDVVEHQFSIEASAAAFEALSADLYTDRVLAPIRELAANAADAHVDAGTTDRPFEIHCPNALEPHFGIRDFGTGLSKTEIETLYTRYFKSTKQHSNAFIGCKGLGSKSPFAYVDSFTVISYYNGKKYIYNCFKNEYRCPAVALLDESDTDEPNGLEVTFPVEKHDVWQFRERIQTALRFFKNMPTVKGWHDFEANAPEYMLETEEFGIAAHSESSLVVMGNIAYPFTAYEFNSTNDTLTNKERKLVDWGVHLYVPIGSVEIAINREKLTYTPDTRATVKQLLAKAVDATEKLANEQLTAAKDIWTARKLIGKVRKGIMGDLVEFGAADLDWNGLKISETIHLSNYPAGEKPSKVEILETEKHESYRRRRHSYGRSVTTVNGFSHWETDAFNVELEVYFVNDLNHGGYAAARRYLEEHGCKKAVMFSADIPQSFIDDVGCKDCLVYTSSLPKPERAPRGSGGSSGVRNERTLLQLWTGSGFENAQVNMSDGGIYVEIRRDKVQRPIEFGSDQFSFESCCCIQQHWKSMQTLGFDEDIYGIRPCDKARMEKHQDEWTTFDQALEDVLRKNKHLLEDARQAVTYADINERSKLDSIAELKIDKDSPLHEAFALYKSCHAAVENKEVWAFRNLNDYAKIYSIDKKATITRKIKKIMDRYPLISHIGWIGGGAKKAVEHYIQLIDEHVAREEEEEAA